MPTTPRGAPGRAAAGLAARRPPPPRGGPGARARGDGPPTTVVVPDGVDVVDANKCQLMFNLTLSLYKI